MKSSSLLILILTCLMLTGISQNDQPSQKSMILIQSFPQTGNGSEDLDLSFETGGSYTFGLHEELKIPQGYVMTVTDLVNGNIFHLPSSEPHYFTVSRPVTKQFRVDLKKVEN